jgi:hypothetical protein
LWAALKESRADRIGLQQAEADNAAGKVTLVNEDAMDGE